MAAYSEKRGRNTHARTRDAMHHSRTQAQAHTNIKTFEQVGLQNNSAIVQYQPLTNFLSFTDKLTHTSTYAGSISK
jgi:hypothetical protein